MNERTNEGTNEWIKESRTEGKKECINERKIEGKNEGSKWMKEWKQARLTNWLTDRPNEWMNEWMNESKTIIIYDRGAQPFWSKGRSVLFLVHSRAEGKIMSWTFENRVKNWIFLKFNLPFNCLWFDIVAMRAVSYCKKSQNCQHID